MKNKILQTCEEIYHNLRTEGIVFGEYSYDESSYLSRNAYHLLQLAKNELSIAESVLKKDWDFLIYKVKEFLKERGNYKEWLIEKASKGLNYSWDGNVRKSSDLLYVDDKNDEMVKMIKKYLGLEKYISGLEERTRFKIEHYIESLSYQEKYNCKIKNIEELKKEIKSCLTILFDYYLNKSNEIEEPVNEMMIDEKIDEPIFKISTGEHKKETKSKKRNATFHNNFKHNVELIMKKCPITGEEFDLEHCHIMPYNCDEATDEDRQNGYNGFLFYYPLHRLFDEGKFTFLNDGTLLISKSMRKTERNLWIDYVINRKRCDIQNDNGKRNKFLDYHRKHVFKGVDDIDQV